MHFLLLFCFLNSSMSNEVSSKTYFQQEIIYDSLPAPEPLKFNEEQIESFRKAQAFDYSESVPRETWWTKLKRYFTLQWNKLLDWILGDYKAEGILLLFLKALPYLIIVGIVLFILWLFKRLNPAAHFLEESDISEVSLTEDEEIIRSRNIEKLIDAAIKEKNFNLAIRYQYLYLLQLLTRNQIISYDSSKTNGEYSREISTGTIRSLFDHLSWIYDYTWYGSFEADQRTYLGVEKKFREMRNLISEG